MKIIVVTGATFPKAGGLYGAVRELFTNKRFQPHHVEILGYVNEETVPKDWQRTCLKLFKKYFFGISWRLKAYMLQSDADIMHMEFIWRYPQILMPIWKKKKKKPIVMSLHGRLDPYIVSHQHWIKRIISKLFFDPTLKSVDCFHALCKKEMEDMRQYGIKGPIAIIPNGVILPDNTKMYKKLDNKKHLLYLGRLHKKKGVDILIEAFAQLVNQDFLEDDWILDIVGWNHEGGKKELDEIVEKYHINSRVIFHGALFGQDKERMYAISDAYILPSHGEGLPLTILEAWSWAKPVVMTAKCNIPEGFEFNAAIEIEDNIDSTKEGLLKIMRMSDLERREVGQRGYQLVKNHFTWDEIADQMIEMYNWLLGNADRPDFIHTEITSK